MRRVVTFVLLVVPVLVTTPQPAQGYADPGSGAMIYQVAYAAFLAGGFYLRRLIKRWGGRK
jgi:hypothetical protein